MSKSKRLGCRLLLDESLGIFAPCEVKRRKVRAFFVVTNAKNRRQGGRGRFSDFDKRILQPEFRKSGGDKTSERAHEGLTYNIDNDVATSNLRLDEMQVRCLKHRTSKTGLTA
jgi:hypothetical protein